MSLGQCPLARDSWPGRRQAAYHCDVHGLLHAADVEWSSSRRSGHHGCCSCCRSKAVTVTVHASAGCSESSLIRTARFATQARARAGCKSHGAVSNTPAGTVVAMWWQCGRGKVSEYLAGKLASSPCWTRSDSDLTQARMVSPSRAETGQGPFTDLKGNLGA